MAQHEAGLALFQFTPAGQLTEQTSVTDGLANAWQPMEDEADERLYVADAQGGLAIYSLSDPLKS